MNHPELGSKYLQGTTESGVVYRIVESNDQLRVHITELYLIKNGTTTLVISRIILLYSDLDALIEGGIVVLLNN